MTRLSCILAALATSAASAAAGGSVSGVYKIRLGANAGTMRIVQDGDFACGTYRGDDGGGGWISGKLDAGKLAGVQTSRGHEASSGSPIALAFTGKTLSGTWTGRYAAALPKAPDVRGDYSVDMGGDKVVIHLEQTGSTVNGKAEYLYSGTPAGTWQGTISGNMVVGTWDDDNNHGRFQWTFSLHKPTWLAIDGSYGVDRDRCDNGGTIKGGRKTR